MNGKYQILLTIGISCLFTTLPSGGYGANISIGNSVSTTGNWTVNGNISATSFSGDGSGLNNVPGTISQGQLEEICAALSSLGIYGNCPSFCGSCPKVVFVSSATYNGNFSGRSPSGGDPWVPFAGIDAAHAKCQALAVAAGLAGVYKAWISVIEDGVTRSPLTDFSHASGPFILRNGVVIANDWNSLLGPRPSYHLLHGIDMTEFGNPIPPGTLTFTNTDIDGGPIHGTHDCGKWQSSSGQATCGNTDNTNSGWTNLSLQNCSDQRRIYCFQQ
jgi:hypothetical protein